MRLNDRKSNVLLTPVQIAVLGALMLGVLGGLLYLLPPRSGYLIFIIAEHAALPLLIIGILLVGGGLILGTMNPARRRLMPSLIVAGLIVLLLAGACLSYDHMIETTRMSNPVTASPHFWLLGR